MIDARVLVVGGGAIGGVVAAKLTGRLRRVTVLDADAAHVARLADPGLVYEERGVEHTVRVEALTTADELAGDYDFALVAVKAPFHRAALEPVVATGRVAAFVSLGNGLIQERIGALVGPERLLACLVEWAGTNVGPGRIVRDTVAPMVIGELDGGERERTRLLARCLEPVGEVRLTRNIRGQIWSKLLVNTTFTGLSAVSGLRYGAVARHPAGRDAAFGLWAEGMRVAGAEGIALERVLDVEPAELAAERATAEAALERLMAIAGNSKPSMLQDLEHGRLTEVDVINGGIAGRARAHGLRTPRNDRVIELVHEIERGEKSPDPAHLADVAASGGSGG
jgi:2-dehydropantoate 2-reductase